MLTFVTERLRMHPRGLRLGQVLMSAPTTVAGDPMLWLARPGVELVDVGCGTPDADNGRDLRWAA